MEIKKGQTSIKFVSNDGTNCKMSVEENKLTIQFDLDINFADFSQEDIKALLPYLQAFTETGTLEPQESIEQLLEDKDLTENDKAAILGMADMMKRAQSPLQGEDQGKLALHIMDTQKEQEERIEALEELVREWRIHHYDGQTLQNASQHFLWEECSDEILRKTAQLLNEEE